MTIQGQLDLGAIVVEQKQNWDDAWQSAPNAEPISASIQAAGIGRFQFRVRYSNDDNIKYPAGVAFQSQSHTQIQRQWVRVIEPTGGTTIWQGRIESDTRRYYGPDNGVQTFTAYDGGNILKKIEISQSAVDHDGGFQLDDQVYPFNRSRESQRFRGNRSIDKRPDAQGAYVFARQFNGQSIPEWTVSDAIEYLMKVFVDSSGTGGPVWTYSGPAINDTLEPIAFQPGTSVLSAIQRIISQVGAYSWVVLPTANGFEYRVFSMNDSGSPVTFGSVTIPANTNATDITSATIPEIDLVIEESMTQGVGRIIVQGEPMKITRSFGYLGVAGADLFPGWLDDPQNAAKIDYYRQARDEVRSWPDFKNLWSRWRARMFDPTKWLADRNPTINDDGTLDTATVGPVPYFSRTLPYITLKEGNDYTNGLPDPELDGELMGPKFFQQSVHNNRILEFDDWPLEGNLKPLDDMIGVQLEMGLPHQASGLLNDITSEVPIVVRFQHQNMTVCFESPQRIKRVWTDPNWRLEDGTKVINVPGAELHYVAPGTILLVDEENYFQGVQTGFVARDDGVQLEKVMAAALVRYSQPRGKLTATARGLFTFQTEVGKRIDSDDPDVHPIVSSVTWRFEDGYQTIMKAGFSE